MIDRPNGVANGRCKNSQSSLCGGFHMQNSTNEVGLLSAHLTNTPQFEDRSGWLLCYDFAHDQLCGAVPHFTNRTKASPSRPLLGQRMTMRISS